jgi:hypothetical protein
MVDSDAELFKEFYGKLLARDQTIGKIIDERFGKTKNSNEINNNSMRKNRFDIDMKTESSTISHFYNNVLTKADSIEDYIRPLEFADLQAIFNINKK